MSEQVEPGRAERFLALGVSGRLAMLGRPLAAFAVRQPLGAFSAVIIALLILGATLAPLLAPSDPYEVDAKAMFIGQGTEGRLLGGDELGRDVLSRLIHGARISLYVSLVSCLLGIAIGSAVGIVSATRGGALDLILQRVIDALMAFPNLILALAIMATMGSSLRNVIIAITIVVIPPTARGVRAQALTIVPMDYITAARAVGAGYWRIIFRHVLPNCLSLVFILASVTLGAAIIIESSLSFLGLGAPPEEPSWGGMIGGAQTYRFLRVAPTLVAYPAIAIGLVVFAFNVLGDALRDIWDPRLRGSREE